LLGCIDDTLAIIISPAHNTVNPVPRPDTVPTEEKIAAIQRAIGAMQYLSSGTLLKRTKVCGNPNCRCARDPAARHGPYFEWSYLKGGRLHHRTLTPKQAQLMRLAIANYRKTRKLLRTWETHTRRLIEINAAE
jgi:hypothetical protein